LQSLVLLAEGVDVDTVSILSMEHKIPGPSESFLALAASKAHSLSTCWWRLTTCIGSISDCLLWQRLFPLLLLLTSAGESHLAIVFLVLKHVNEVIEQLATVATYQDVRVAVCFEVSKLQRDGFWDVALRLLGRTELLALRGSLS